MPYYLETDDPKVIKKLRLQNVCSVCGERLAVWLDPESHRRFLACSDWLRSHHEGIAKQYQERRELNIESRREEMEQKLGKETTTTLEQRRLPTSGILTQSQAMQILKLVYPKVPEAEIIRCAILCQDFGLHPLMKEIYIIPFGQGDKQTWATVIGIGATRKMAAQKGTYSYLDNTPRVMTKGEQEQIFGEIDDVNIHAITKLRTRTGLEAQGYGAWPKGKEPYGMDKGNTKANMAFIRSERNAFSRLFSDAIPKDVDVVDGTYIDVPDVGLVERKTGEIIEEKPTKDDPFGDAAKAKVAQDNAQAKSSPTVEQTGKDGQGKGEQPPARDPKSIKSMEELARALKQDFDLPISEQWRRLGIKDWNGLAISTAEAYIKVKESMKGEVK